MEIHIYTASYRIDDGCIYGYSITDKETFEDSVKGEKYTNTSVPRMLIRCMTEAIVSAILIPDVDSISIYCPSDYITDAITKGWVKKWIRQDFKKNKHKDLWVKLDSLLDKITSDGVSFSIQSTQYTDAVGIDKDMFDMAFKASFKAAKGEPKKDMSSKMKHKSKKYVKKNSKKKYKKHKKQQRNDGYLKKLPPIPDKRKTTKQFHVDGHKESVNLDYDPDSAPF